jgi:hypothetical protein
MSLTDDFNRIDLEAIDRFVTELQEEDLHLEFKTATAPEINREDRKNLASAISGFANADGGLIVWGISDRIDPNDGTRRALAKAPISALSVFATKLNEFTSKATNPSVDGVDHRKVPISEDSGYLVTMVPASDSGPHMAKLGEDRYYRRSGSSFLRMEHFEIAEMFGRRPRAKLGLFTRLDPAGLRGNDRYFRCVLGIENTGRGVARFPLLRVKTEPPLYRVDGFGGLDGNGNNGLPRIAQADNSNWIHFGGGADSIIHPGMRLDVTAIRGSAGRAEKPPGLIEQIPSLVVHYVLAADGVPPFEGTKTIESSDLVDASTGRAPVELKGP